MTYRYVNEWDDLIISPVAVNLVGAPSPAALNTTWVTLDFENNEINTVQLVYQLPHSYKVGSDLHLHIHWQPSSTSEGSAAWEYKWYWRNNGEVDPGKDSWNSGTIETVPDGTARKLQISEIAVFSKEDAEISSLLQVELSRLGDSDSFSGDVQVVSMDCHVLKDSWGSREEYVK